MPGREVKSMQTREITRSDVRSATIKGFRQLKSSPSSVKLTKGQKDGIVQRRSKG